MAAKRGSSAGGGCGLLGVFLVLGAVGLLIKYWWVVLIALGVVALTVGIVRLARTPIPPKGTSSAPRPSTPTAIRSPRPMRPNHPTQTAKKTSPRGGGQGGKGRWRARRSEFDADAVYREHRSKKREEQAAALRGWDRLFNDMQPQIPDPPPATQSDAGPGAVPARAMQQPPDPLRDKVPQARHAVLARFHADLIKLHEARVAEASEDPRPAAQTEGQHSPIRGNGDGTVFLKGIPADTASAPPAEPRALLSGDTRTMWAWAVYLEGHLSMPVTDGVARQVLAAIPPGDHVEVFGAVAMVDHWGRNRQSTEPLPPEARFAARTFDRWILTSPSQQAEIIPASSATRRITTAGLRHLYIPPQSMYELDEGRNMKAYGDIGDERAFDRFEEGAGRDILRLPDSPLAPAPPKLGIARSPKFASPSLPLGDLHSSEYGERLHGSDDALVAAYIESVTERVHKAHANYGSLFAEVALYEAHGADRVRRAINYLRGAVEAVKYHPRIATETHKDIVSHFRNADLRAAFFCQVLGLPYPGDAPLSTGPRPLKPTDFY